MEVITIESEAFQKILNEIQEIKTAVENGSKENHSVDKWLDNDEAAALLKVTKRTLQTYRDEGEIAFSQKGSKIYYRSTDIEEFLLRHHHKAFKYNR